VLGLNSGVYTFVGGDNFGGSGVGQAQNDGVWGERTFGATCAGLDGSGVGGVRSVTPYIGWGGSKSDVFYVGAWISLLSFFRGK